MDNREIERYKETIADFTGWSNVRLRNPYIKAKDGADAASIGKLKSEFKEFLRANKDKLTKNGVYRFVDHNDSTYYIGDAKNLKDRIWTKARNDFNQDLSYKNGDSESRQWAIWDVYEDRETIVDFAVASEYTEVVLLAAFKVGTGSLPETNSTGPKAHRASKKAIELAEEDSLFDELMELYETHLSS